MKALTTNVLPTIFSLLIVLTIGSTNAYSQVTAYVTNDMTEVVEETAETKRVSVKSQEISLLMAIKSSLMAHIVYPEIAVENAFEETCQFLIELDGNGDLLEITLIKGNAEVFEEAVQAAAEAVDFAALVPANYKGQRVFFFPVNFQLR